MTLEHATHTTYKITRFDSEEWLNYNKKERSKPLKNEPNCLKPDPPRRFGPAAEHSQEAPQEVSTQRENAKV